jgi:hypothetical protein
MVGRRPSASQESRLSYSIILEPKKKKSNSPWRTADTWSLTFSLQNCEKTNVSGFVWLACLSLWTHWGIRSHILCCWIQGQDVWRWVISFKPQEPHLPPHHRETSNRVVGWYVTNCPFIPGLEYVGEEGSWDSGLSIYKKRNEEFPKMQKHQDWTWENPPSSITPSGGKRMEPTEHQQMGQAKMRWSP